MYDVEVVPIKADVLSVKILINQLLSVLFEKQFSINFIKICKNCTNLFR